MVGRARDFSQNGLQAPGGMRSARSGNVIEDRPRDFVFIKCIDRACKNTGRTAVSPFSVLRDSRQITLTEPSLDKDALVTYDKMAI